MVRTAKSLKKMVGTRGIEPLTSTVSRRLGPINRLTSFYSFFYYQRVNGFMILGFYLYLPLFILPIDTKKIQKEKENGYHNEKLYKQGD